MLSPCLTLKQTCRSAFTQSSTRQTPGYSTIKQSISSRSARTSIRPLASTQEDSPAGVSRREAEILLLSLIATALQADPAQALGFKKELKRRKIPLEEYSVLPCGLKFYDLKVGSGKEVVQGAEVTVHFDAMFKGIDVVSSRSARLLGGNRTIAEPFQFYAGQPVSEKKAKPVGDSAGGLFSGQSGPRPPAAMSPAVLGMRVGGKRSVIVPPELGYGDKGELEIGPGETFELRIEVLGVE